MLDAITLKQLRSLKTVADTGSMTEAAVLQSLSTPAIHSQIKKLENTLGVRLLTKTAEQSGLIATAEGRVLIAAIERIDGILGRARDNLAALGDGWAGHVRIGFESTGRYFAPRIIALLQRTHPRIEVSFDVANRKQVIERFDQSRLDLAIMGRPPRMPGVVAEPIGQHPYGIFVPPGHDLIKRGDYDPESLLAQTIFAREPGSGTRILLDRYLDQIEGYGAPNLLQLDANESIKECVMAGLGVAMLSFHVVQRELAQKQLVALDWPRLPIMRYWYLVSEGRDDVAESTQKVRRTILDDQGAFIAG
jgi:DNA-binding transcriptional LysR family regulator